MNHILLEVREISHYYKFKHRQKFWALQNVSFKLHSNEILGIAGESGAGKSTRIRIVAGLESPSAGQIFFKGKSLPMGRFSALRKYYHQIGMVFQHPYASFNPRWPIGRSIAEPLRVEGDHTQEQQQRVAEMCGQIGLPLGLLQRYPHQLSGGQLQRAAIARALIRQPQLLLLDEPTAALDLSIQAQIINLLQQLQQQYGFSMIIVSHDLAVLYHLTHRLLIMKAGRVVEEGETQKIIDHPEAGYTRELVEAAFML